MKWVWQADSGGFTLALCQSGGLVYREVTFGWVDSKNRAYESWGGKKVAEADSMIEAKRLLIEHVLSQINNAHKQTKVEYQRGEQ